MTTVLSVIFVFCVVCCVLCGLARLEAWYKGDRWDLDDAGPFFRACLIVALLSGAGLFVLLFPPP